MSNSTGSANGTDDHLRLPACPTDIITRNLCDHELIPDSRTVREIAEDLGLSVLALDDLLVLMTRDDDEILPYLRRHIAKISIQVEIAARRIAALPPGIVAHGLAVVQTYDHDWIG